MARDDSEGKPMFKRLALIGVGLIGSSISHAARRAGIVGEIACSALTAAERQRAEALGLATKVYADPVDAVKGADLIILCAPVGAFKEIAEAIGPHLEKGAIVSDVGSVKAAAVRDIAPSIPDGVHFIAGHPIAGTEQSGPDAGFAELFDGRWCILTPAPDADAASLARLEEFWRKLGSNVELMTPEHHDMVLAITSHVPHLIAYNIVNTAAHLERVTDSEVIKFSAAGFRDFTRIAASDPVMWRDVFLNNKEAVLEMLGRFSEDLVALQRAIRFGDGPTLEHMFTEARAVRRGIIQAGQDTEQPDFGRNVSRVREKSR
ncbi:prephenate/arogenate dehydrogenase family protein [Hyphomicrobium sp.]|jgi:cyclohexadieny/prephenate dehydrogenase|uniref:prephenate/arogenate dehydrogenase family protein n=1 Tax=Hyphomicrobium sp. TaxID=82 RepID=UPI0035623075